MTIVILIVLLHDLGCKVLHIHNISTGADPQPEELVSQRAGLVAKVGMQSVIQLYISGSKTGH